MIPSFQRPAAPSDELFDAEETGLTSAGIWMTLTGFARLRKETLGKSKHRAVPLGKALRMRVRIGRWTSPLSILVGVAMTAASCATMGLVLSLTHWLAPDEATSLPIPPAVPASIGAPPPSKPALPSSPAEPTDIARAAMGDSIALRLLEGREPRELSVEQVIAIHEGRQAQRRRRLTELARHSSRRAALDVATLRLSEGLDDATLAPEVLRLLTKKGGATGVDLLYAVREDDSRDPNTRRLARRLLQTDEVRRDASQALAIALELEEVRDCFRAAELIASAIANGDRRSLTPLARLNKMSGCGSDGASDCFPCLRNNTDLAEAVQSVSQRQAPTLPPLARAKSARRAPAGAPSGESGTHDPDGLTESRPAATAQPSSTRDPGF